MGNCSKKCCVNTQQEKNAALVKKLTISGKCISDFSIVYDSSKGPSVTYAAEELEKYIFQTVGKELVLADGDFSVSPAIKLVYCEDMTESYAIKTVDGNLEITGGKRGILYGVYSFLEDYIGWLFLPYGTDVLMPENEQINIDNLDCKYDQYFEFRAPFWCASSLNSYAAKNMVNYKIYRKGDIDKLGGFYGFTGGFVHTYAALLGDTSYEGSIGSNACFYDENNYSKVLASVMRILGENPDTDIISVSANDSGSFCQCDKCQGRDVGGNVTDGVLGFVNKIADEVAKKYPRVKIHTLAYGPTQSTPKVTVPRDNVIIQLCSIRCCFQHPLEDECTDANKTFMNDLREWSKLCKNLYIWDYTTNYRFYLTPFPNFKVLRQNMQTFLKHGVKGVFEQGNEHNLCGEFGELKAYLLAKLMKNPYMTEQEYDGLVNKFMKGYYGDGWEYIRKYYDFLIESNSKYNHVGIYAVPERMYVPQDFIDNMDKINDWFDKAEALAKDEQTLKHIKGTRISYKYLELYYKYNPIMESGDAEEIAKLKEECIKGFDDVVDAKIRLIDVHPPLGQLVDRVCKTDHPRKWSPGAHALGTMKDHGMPGSDDLGDEVYGNNNKL